MPPSSSTDDTAFPLPMRGTSATVNLYFDGRTGADDFPGTWGAAVFITTTVPGSDEPRADRANFSGRLGHGTDQVAQYMGLIGGLRGLIRHLQAAAIRYSYASLIVISDSKLVIDHMLGRATVSDPRHAVLYEVAKGLEMRFLRVHYKHVYDEKNAAAREQVDAAHEVNLPQNAKAIYYPSQLGLVDAWVHGQRTLASCDFVTSGRDPSFYVDARFLHSLSGYGADALRNLDDPYPLAMVTGKAQMTVLGTVNLEVGVRWIRDTPDDSSAMPSAGGVVNVIVVDSFPVPLHVSTKNATIDLISGLEEGEEEIDFSEVPFAAESLPESFRESPYWTSDICFIGYEPVGRQ